MLRSTVGEGLYHDIQIWMPAAKPEAYGIEVRVQATSPQFTTKTVAKQTQSQGEQPREKCPRPWTIGMGISVADSMGPACFSLPEVMSNQ